MFRIVTVVGARPQFIKAALVSSALKGEGLEERIVHTGQHFDASMSDIFFEELGIDAPAYNLSINSMGHGAMTGRMLEAVEELLLMEMPDMMLVYGDTNSTVAGALAAAKLHIPIAHVEAGLRSFNRRMPEEINRVLTDHLSSLLLCPTAVSVENLAREGITNGVHSVGDVMFDATLEATRRGALQSTILESLALTPKSYAVATVHRAENTDDPERFGEVFAWLRDRASHQPVVLPVHPRTRKLLEDRHTDTRGMRLIQPLGYLDMARLLNNASSIFTDSGGVQKEAYFHRVPCTTLRDETEWVETIAAGWNRLWKGPDFAPQAEIHDYGTGKSAGVIAAAIRGWLEGSASRHRTRM